ncbi:xylan 1,4-beta-xylosidase [Streptomyces sp. NBC_00083]|uniref:xylan 1,4-beta-xylosidase n=1 Tax=Streptomyces sp. NBC_00083 TaxID=2975647 RepID=UPI002258D4BE|nr:xylan 1,4-beta-xylosidase [Streptomyces sp. NBC_00083]MCX5383326.1 xylan 1,4-beta-xylosidase [Streptomyces sp. NBC_00083]
MERHREVTVRGDGASARRPGHGSRGASGRRPVGAPRRRLSLVLAALVLAALALAGCDSGGRTTQGPGPGPGPTGPSNTDPALGWGFTHTQYSADTGDDDAVARARELLSGRGLPQDQAIMGWGAGNPEPSPGTYDFSDLDRRVAYIRSTGATPVITLCCAPDWMKGGKAGASRTDWSVRSLESAPLPSHYKDFAELAAAVAERYPDVRHFIVWNEFKGFFDDTRRRWNYEGYTQLYNEVYAALKKADPANLVGGPYLTMDSYGPQDQSYASSLKGPWGSVDQRVLDAFTYWNKHRKGADFVVVDGASFTRTDQMLPDAFAATDKLTAVSDWVREQSGLPLWWAEYYVEPDASGWSEQRRVATQAAALAALARGGTGTAFYWSPEQQGGPCPGCLWSPTQRDDGGAELPMYALIARFAAAFPPGTRFTTVSVAADDVPNVRVLANATTVLVVNTLDREIDAKVDGRSFPMAAYEVRWLTR